MAQTLILWGHALAALLFGALALRQARAPTAGLPRRALVAALACTALWALAVAGIDPRDVVTQIAQTVRNLAWLGLMYALVGQRRPVGYPLGALYVAVALLSLVFAGLAIGGAATTNREALASIAAARLLFGLMTAVGALLLAHQLDGAEHVGRTSGVRLVALALALIWGIDAVLFAVGYARGEPSAALIATRGLVLVGVAALLALAVDRSGDRSPKISRAATIRLLSVAAAALYVGTIVVLTNLAAAFAGTHARVAQTGIVFGATAALLTLLSTPWLRAWARVKVAKHLFAHRYDYRAEWQRFTDTLGRPAETKGGATGAPLGQRIVKAVANLTDSPCGLLLVPEGAGLGTGAIWNRDAPARPQTADRLATYLAHSRRIVDLDAVRDESGAAEDAAAVPRWMLDEPNAWAIVPLIHREVLAGAILLDRPPVPRALDWEDLDLLRVAGRQAASYLAEDRARAALVDAERFDEFNRRFAFILHDIKNLASQQSLVARNAERHAENPAFRADMIATLKDSASRMTALLARLSHHDGGGSAGRPRPVDVPGLLGRIAAIRRSQHPVEWTSEAGCIACADPTRLEQVLLHLVQNAVEASPLAQPVVLTCGRVDDRVAIDVIDTGAGMTPGFVRDQLFRPFVSTKPSGFGIGAYEARLLVEAMDGTLEVVSREGEGTRFRIFLPLAPALEAAA